MIFDSLTMLAALSAVMFPAVLGWFIALRFGFWVGAVVPVLIAVGPVLVSMAYEAGMEPGARHPEEAMGRGLVLLLIWLPANVSAMAGFAIGLIHRVKRRPLAARPG